MHVNEDGSSTYVASRKRRIFWGDIKRLSVRIFHISFYFILCFFFFFRADLLRGYTLFIYKDVNNCVFYSDNDRLDVSDDDDNNRW